MESQSALIQEQKRLCHEIEIKKLSISKSKGLLRTINVENLPDKGKKLENKLSEQEVQLIALQKELKEVEQILSNKKSSPENSFSTHRGTKIRVFNVSSSSDSSVSSEDSSLSSENSNVAFANSSMSSANSSVSSANSSVPSESSKVSPVNANVSSSSSKNLSLASLPSPIRPASSSSAESVVVLSDSDAKDSSYELQNEPAKNYSKKPSKYYSVLNDSTKKDSLSPYKPKIKLEEDNSKKSLDDAVDELTKKVSETSFLKPVSKPKEDSFSKFLSQKDAITNEVKKKSQEASFVKSQNSVKEKLPWYALPSANFKINELGKQALNTHKIQQSLTLDSLRTIHKSLETMPDENILMADPKYLKNGVELMPHQKHALAWLLWREKQKPRGGILADDMGLGKTLTMISLVLKKKEIKEEEEENKLTEDEDDNDDEWTTSSSRPKKYPGGTLVICPASLLSQWEGEVNQRVQQDTLRTLLHYGAKREGKARRVAKYDIVITTYGIVQSDGKSPDSSPLFGITWDRIIIDEAHQVRNPKTQSSIAVCLLSAKNRWALTGTPIHNKQLDMYGLLKFLKCKPFDDLAVWKRWVDNRDAAGTKRLNTVVKSILLRRTKEQLLTKGSTALPPKVLKKIYVKLSDDEMEVYHKILHFSSTLFAQYLHQRAEKEELNTYGVIINRKKNVNDLKDEEIFKNNPELQKLFEKQTQCGNIKAHHVLVSILRLRQMCCHPSLISAMIDKEAISADGIEEDGLDLDFMDQFTRMSLVPSNSETLDEVAVDSKKILSSDHPLFNKDRINSKVKKVLEVLENEVLVTDDKAVIVSQWTGFLNIVEELLKKKNIKCDVLTGAIPVPDRGPIVERFNKPGHGPKVLLLSLTAGGCGLNLIGGNHLLLLDIHWNPQLENQACDRVYRVGQKKDVFIYRFVTVDTIEEAIEIIQQKKLAVADQVLTGAKKIKPSQLSLDDIKLLFGMIS